MEIRECLEKYYDELCDKCRNIDQVIYDSKTCEDILNNTVITAIKKYDGKDAPEEELFEYIKKSFLTLVKFSWKRRGMEKILFTDNLNVYDKGGK